MGVAKPSVTKALGNLARRGLAEVVGRDVRLTEEGGRLAEATLDKHRFFERLLVESGVDAETASAEACRMEHCLSEDSYRRFAAYLGSRRDDGNEHRAIAAKPRDAEVQRLPLRKEQTHGSRISRMPVRQDPRADTGHVLGGGDSDTLTCEQERGLRMEPPRGRPPATEEDDGQKEGALRVQGRAPRVEQTARDVIVVRQNLSGRPASIRVEIVPAQIN